MWKHVKRKTSQARVEDHPARGGAVGIGEDGKGDWEFAAPGCVALGIEAAEELVGVTLADLVTRHARQEEAVGHGALGRLPAAVKINVAGQRRGDAVAVPAEIDESSRQKIALPLWKVPIALRPAWLLYLWTRR